MPELEVYEKRAAEMYDNGFPIGAIREVCPHMKRSDIMHAVAIYRREKRLNPPECRHCPWRIEGRPCVWPRGMCGVFRHPEKEDE